MGQLLSSRFKTNDPTEAGAVERKPLPFNSVSVNPFRPAQVNGGLAKVRSKAAAFDPSLSGIASHPFGDIEPIVMRPCGLIQTSSFEQSDEHGASIALIRHPPHREAGADHSMKQRPFGTH